MIQQVDGVPVRHEQVRSGAVTLHVAVAGEGPPIVLLHGFPENWWAWRRQIPALARAGFSVWAADMRGYNLSDRPTDRAAYHLRHLVDDVTAIVRATGCERAHIGGHDWGGIVAWTFAGQHPERVDKLVIFNAPHMEIFRRKARRPPQIFRSSYVLFFALPRLPEWLFAARDFAMLRRIFTRLPARADAFEQRDIEQFVAGMSSPGALTAALNYYRANLGGDGLALARSARIAAETLVVWGDRDPALGPELLDGLETVAPRVDVRRFGDVGHWVHVEAASDVNEVVLRFLLSTSRP